jgi:hypothetical protein
MVPTGRGVWLGGGQTHYGVPDEIACRVWLAGGRVQAVRRDDIPGRGRVAAILRHAPSLS